jgi:hypothetical protein
VVESIQLVRAVEGDRRDILLLMHEDYGISHFTILSSCALPWVADRQHKRIRHGETSEIQG